MKAHCTAMIWDAEATCTVAIMEAEMVYMGHTHTLQQSLGESMQDLQCKATEKEGQDHQSLLEACEATLQACPPKDHGVLMYPLELLTGNMSLAALLATTPQLATTVGTPTPTTSLSPHWKHSHLQQGPNNDAIHPTRKHPPWDQGRKKPQC